ncbi:uncharacterized protein LOC106161456 [Lingula anatina]|uniref:Uncharacterized protein LOC106161456 n=1 Tax=Lingula anatina TaxID=7574 RepID=A0A2R2MRR8_LINAN|nr:uncharacterized protein LOC106161456 [Lingula anatina]|eukprot:XP_023932949.1 uncharacterized protein LOC106161456 [Lingula anatina]
MKAQLSTSLSDLILALVSYHGTWSLWQHNKMASVGLLIVAMAASCGTIRFYFNRPSERLICLHTTLSWLGATLGLPFVAVGYAQHNQTYIVAHANIAVPVAYFLSHKFLSGELRKKTAMLVTGVAILSVLILSTLKFNPYALTGALAYVASGAVGTDGLGPLDLPRVDWFHYLLVVGNVAFVLALSQRAEPVFYKKH